MELSIAPLTVVNDKAVSCLAREIAAKIQNLAPQLAPGDRRFESEPIRFCLRREWPAERDFDEPSSGIKITSSRGPPAGFEGGAYPAELQTLIKKHLASAARKFSSHPDSRAILLLDVCSAELHEAITEDIWRKLLSGRTIPENVHEVWIGFQYDVEQWSYSRLVPEDSKAAPWVVV